MAISNRKLTKLSGCSINTVRKWRRTPEACNRAIASHLQRIVDEYEQSGGSRG